MHKRAPKFEWQIVDQQHAPWPPVVDTMSSAPAVTYHPYRRPIYGGVAALLLLLAIAGGWLWHKAQVGLEQVERELRTTVQTELTSAPPIFTTPTTTWETSPTADAWKTQLRREDEILSGVLPSDAAYVRQETNVQMINLQGDLAVTKFVTPAKDGSQAYHQTRFYRYSGAGWLRTRPVAELWGAPHRLESSHFIFHFRQNDAEVIAVVAPQMDDVYAELQHNFDLTPDAEKLVIEVSVEHVTGAVLTPQWAYKPLVVPSPAIYLAPVELNDSAILAQSISLPLIEYMGERAMKDHAIPTRWRPLLRGLRLWQLWNLEMPLAHWQQELVKWLYVDAPRAAVEQTSMLPVHYTELCAMHRLWMLSPTMVGVPLECTAWSDLVWSSSRWETYVPRTRLDELSVPLAYREQPFDRELHNPYDYSQPVVIANLIEYAVEVYGDEKLPLLIANLAQYNNWDTLTPAVYGVSSAEFEEGWRAYLVQEDGATID